jgi:hypothetical protein
MEAKMKTISVPAVNDVVIIKTDGFYYAKGDIGLVLDVSDPSHPGCCQVQNEDGNGWVVLKYEDIEVIDHIDEPKDSWQDPSGRRSGISCGTDCFPWPYNGQPSMFKRVTDCGPYWLNGRFVRFVIDEEQRKIFIKCFGCDHVLHQLSLDIV